MTDKISAEKTVPDIRQATRRHYSAEEKIRVVLEGLFEVRTVLVNCGVAKASTAMPITAGGRLELICPANAQTA